MIIFWTVSYISCADASNGTEGLNKFASLVIKTYNATKNQLTSFFCSYVMKADLEEIEKNAEEPENIEESSDELRENGKHSAIVSEDDERIVIQYAEARIKLVHLFVRRMKEEELEDSLEKSYKLCNIDTMIKDQIQEIMRISGMSVKQLKASLADKGL